MDYAKDIDSLVELVVKEGASDLHMSEGRHPYIRLNGSLVPLLKHPKLERKDMEKILDIIVPEFKKPSFKEKKSVDFAYSHNGDRFRSHAFVQQSRLSLAMRYITTNIRTLQELRLPDSLAMFAKKQEGFFLCVGPTGHGKSTTLAALVEMINVERLDRIVTIEDPIEYIFTPKKSIIDQREVGEDTPSFHEGLRDTFREDMDCIMIGELRDAESIQTAVTAAETGHLVFGTLHTNGAAGTVERIIDSFGSSGQQDQIRIQLSSSLSGIFSQRLVPRIAGGLIPAYELLINTSAVSNLIRENRTHEISVVIETGVEEGMIDFNRSLAALVQAGEISVENAYLYSTNPKMLEKLL
jgi:twitching motility protein PilT